MPKRNRKAKANETLAKLVRRKNIVQVVAQKKRKNHTTEECYFNARAHPKSQGKGDKKGSNQASVNAVETTMEENVSALQQQVSALNQQLANSQSQASNPAITATSSHKTHQGAVAAGNPNMCFADPQQRFRELKFPKIESPRTALMKVNLPQKYKG
jgi:hypothetical protein